MLTTLAMATIVGLLIFVQLIRAKPVDSIASWIIGICFVVAVLASAKMGVRTRE
jgi:hypothetical protein